MAKKTKAKAKVKVKAKVKAKRIVRRVKISRKPRAGAKPPREGRALASSKGVEAMLKQQELVEESKYYPAAEHVHFRAPQGSAKPPREGKELPQGYGDNRIVLMVRDPYWAYAYWEITADKKDEIARRCGVGWNNLTKVLRVYDVTNIIFNGTNANSYFDIEINDYAFSWYINLGRPDTSWCVDLGVKTPSGEFIMIVRSNCITTPRDTASWITDEEWMIVEEDFRKLYALSGGLRVGLSSAGLKEAMAERLRFELASGAVKKKG